MTVGQAVRLAAAIVAGMALGYARGALLGAIVLGILAATAEIFAEVLFLIWRDAQDLKRGAESERTLAAKRRRATRG